MAKPILIADDDENDALAISQTLRRAGIKNPLRAVNDGVEVIAYFKGQGKYLDRIQFPIPGLLLLDLKMPRISGFAVLEWLNDQKDLRTNTLVVVLTGHGDLEKVKRAYSLGARSFLMKPCEIDDIKNLIRSYSAYWETEARKKSVAATSRDYAGGGPVAGASL